jgi:hypothetical protein
MRALLFVVLLGGCAGRVKEARAIQPNPLLAQRSVDELAVSETLYIHQRVPSTAVVFRVARQPLLRSSAQFTVASRDRLRFHVGIARFYDDEADTRRWRAWLEDDRGHRVEPERREVAHIDRYQGLPVLGGLSVYVGCADYVFHGRDLITRDTRGLTLVLSRDDETYRFVWQFEDGRHVQHHGYEKLDEDLRALVIPGRRFTRPLSTQYEDDVW